MSLDSDDVGLRLQRVRSALDWTMDQLATRSGVSQSTISKIEIGVHRPIAANVEKIAKAMSVDPCWLCYGTGPEPDCLAGKAGKTGKDKPA